MSFRDRPSSERGEPSSIGSVTARVLAWLRTHYQTWARRYVEMRVDARTDR